MKYLYHMYATHETAGKIRQIHGVAVRDSMFESAADYKDFEQSLCTDFDIPLGEITVCSLSLLNPGGTP